MPASLCPCLLASSVYFLCSTIATVTTLVEGVSWEQQVWILDLLSALIRKRSVIRPWSTPGSELSAKKCC